MIHFTAVSYNICWFYNNVKSIVYVGRDGYMGVGLSAQGVNMNRLPGWDKHSYGYHGDDGNSFCSSGTGQAYGPTFTTNDIIGKNVLRRNQGRSKFMKIQKFTLICLILK